MAQGRLEEGQLRDSEVREPEVPLAVDGRVMVMKSDDMNLQLRGKGNVSRTHTILPRIGPMDYTPERSPEINITQCRAGRFCSVSTFICFKRDGGET